MLISQLLRPQTPPQASSNRPPNSSVPNPQLDDSRSNQSSPTPSTDASKVINRCGNCRQRGHNRKTCPLPEAPKPPPIITRPRARGCCGLCGEPGHNRTSCRTRSPK